MVVGGILYLFNRRCLPYCTQSWKDSSAIFSLNMVMIVPMVVEIWLEAAGCTIAEVAMVWLLRVVGRWCWVDKNVAGRDKNVAGRGYANGVCKIFFVPGTQLELGRKLAGNALEYPKWVLKMGWGTQKSLPAEIAWGVRLEEEPFLERGFWRRVDVKCDYLSWAILLSQSTELT